MDAYIQKNTEWNNIYTEEYRMGEYIHQNTEPTGVQPHLFSISPFWFVFFGTFSDLHIGSNIKGCVRSQVSSPNPTCNHKHRR